MNILQLMLLAFLLTFLISAALGPVVIKMFKRLKFGQSVRANGPVNHLKKNGIPTMGGVIFLFSITLVSLAMGQFDLTLFLLIFCTLGFGLIGLVDDALKIKKRNSDGLSTRQKLVSQIVIALIFALLLINKVNSSTDVFIPFYNKSIDLKWIYIPTIIFLMVGTVNGANLTDGLDGLASSVTIFIGFFFCAASVLISRSDIFADGVMKSAGTLSLNNVGMFCGAICGGVGGFLIYNSHPAKIIMGDTGSQALGGAIASIAIVLRLPMFLFLVAFIYGAEILSVVLQVTSYKLTGKRVLKMAPIHHHFELCGWSENQIVFFFTFVTAVFCILGIRMIQ